MEETRTTPAVVTIAVCGAYIALIVLANFLSTKYGLVSVGFGLSASAGVFAAGATLTVRDIVQRTSGRRVIAALIAIGIVVSYAVGDGRIALASAVAFAISEVLDYAVYTPLRSKGWSLAVWASFIVAAPVDTIIFLKIAKFPSDGLGVLGQLVGKGWATLIVWSLSLLVIRLFRRDEVPASI